MTLCRFLLADGTILLEAEWPEAPATGDEVMLPVPRDDGQKGLVWHRVVRRRWMDTVASIDVAATGPFHDGRKR